MCEVLPKHVLAIIPQWNSFGKLIQQTYDKGRALCVYACMFSTELLEVPW